MTARIQVKETQRYWGDFEGSLESIISSLQSELDGGWEGIETEYERDYGDCHDHEVPYLYKHRPETDKEYAKRMKELEKKKEEEPTQEDYDAFVLDRGKSYFNDMMGQLQLYIRLEDA